MKKSDVKVGDRVTVKVREEAYYSGYAGNPECWMEPGVIGVVGAIHVPKVHPPKGSTKGWCDEFVCVDFRVPGKFQGNPVHKYDIWRAGVEYNNIVRAKEL